MARHDAQNWPESTKMIGLLCFVASIISQHGILGQRVKVDPEVTSYPGQSVNLRCSFSDPTGVQLSMVTWIYESKDGERKNIAVLHPSFDPNYPDSPVKGRVSFLAKEMTRPSIQITDLRMSDEGKYICEYATYPSGNEQGTTQLVMLAKPVNSASTVSVEAGTQTVTVAKCESANGLPAAKISWVTTAKGNETTTTKAGTDNTVTVTSEYRMVPTSADNGKDISCVVAHRTLEKPESFKMKLAVLFAPEVSIAGYDNNWYIGRTSTVLTCQATANPVPTSVLWKTMSGEMPDTVQISGNQLKVLKVDETVNTTFVCEVKNRLGTSKSQVTIVVRGTPLPAEGPTTGSIIGAIIGVIIIFAIIGTVIAMFRKHKKNVMNGEGPPKHKPPPPKKTNPSSQHVPVLYSSEAQDRLLQNPNYPNHPPEPVTDLDSHQDYDDDLSDYGDDGQMPQHYKSAAPSGWDDPNNDNVPPPYMTINHDTPEHSVGRGDSFISSEMIV
ncbi:nectin-2 [Oryzias melastigma]|uniref:Si:ch73-22o12.1 n=1 Tax=Oryzias melastigma TaxID=30732 RepID=A0A3B3DKZ5_ORYME|nr:nectin-2 [Oryzias melastigma]